MCVPGVVWQQIYSSCFWEVGRIYGGRVDSEPSGSEASPYEVPGATPVVRVGG
jgi:hypothetical protein